MNNSIPVYSCKICGAVLTDKDKRCPKCRTDLLKTGRNISLSFSDSIRISDNIFTKLIKKGVTLKWDADSLALVGIFFTIVIGLVPLIDLLIKNLELSLVFALVLTLLLLIFITKVKLIRNFSVRFFRWFLKQ